MKAYYATNKILIEGTTEEMEYLRIGAHLGAQFAEQMSKRENNTAEERNIWEKCRKDNISIETDLRLILDSMPF